MVGVSLWFVLVGSGYLHALNLVSLVRALLVRVPGWCGYLHALNLVPAGSCPWLVRAGWKWLPAYFEPRACWLVCPCALLVRAGLCGYLHALKLVPCWFVCPCALLVRAGWK